MLSSIHKTCTRDFSQEGEVLYQLHQFTFVARNFFDEYKNRIYKLKDEKEKKRNQEFLNFSETGWGRSTHAREDSTGTMFTVDAVVHARPIF